MVECVLGLTSLVFLISVRSVSVLASWKKAGKLGTRGNEPRPAITQQWYPHLNLASSGGKAILLWPPLFTWFHQATLHVSLWPAVFLFYFMCIILRPLEPTQSIFPSAAFQSLLHSTFSAFQESCVHMCTGFGKIRINLIVSKHYLFYFGFSKPYQ